MSKHWSQWVIVGLMLIASGLMAYNAQAQSHTMDEQNHIARGYVFLRTHDPRMSAEHPPLINSLEALPLLMLPNVRLPLDDWSWEAGEWYRFADLFLWGVNHDADRMLFLARLPVIGLTLLLAAIAARWAGELWGKSGALLTLAMVMLDPNVLAHGSLATTDIGQTLTVFLTGYIAWRTAQSLSPFAFVLTGAAMGTMLASKISSLAFMGVFGVLLVGDALVRAWGRPDWLGKVARRIIAVIIVTLIAVLVLWGMYAFEMAPSVKDGPRLPMGTYWRGVLSIFEQTQGGRASYLLGQTSTHGWWTYFPIAFAVKTPLATLALLLLAIPISFARKHWFAYAFLLVPALAYWAMIVQSSLNLGYRHLLPTLPFMYVWAGQVATCQLKKPGFGELRSHRKSWFLILLSGWLALETVLIAPYFLSYFNPIGGGPTNGWKILADSNIDWGQDLKYLRDYVKRHNLGKIKLSWFGSCYPEGYGIEYEPLPGLPHHFNLWDDLPFNPEQPEPGVYAISVSNLVEILFEDKQVFPYFRAREPDARIGYSIYIYYVTKANQ